MSSVAHNKGAQGPEKYSGNFKKHFSIQNRFPFINFSFQFLTATNLCYNQLDDFYFNFCDSQSK